MELEFAEYGYAEAPCGGDHCLVEGSERKSGPKSKLEIESVVGRKAESDDLPDGDCDVVCTGLRISSDIQRGKKTKAKLYLIFGQVSIPQLQAKYVAHFEMPDPGNKSSLLSHASQDVLCV